MLDCLFIGSTTKDTLLMVDAPPASDQRIPIPAEASRPWRPRPFKSWGGEPG